MGYDIGLTNPAVRTYCAELRARNEEVDAYVALGFFIEGEDGFLSEGERPEEMELREVAEARGLMSRANDYRQNLFSEFAEANTADTDDDPDPALIAQLGTRNSQSPNMEAARASMTTTMRTMTAG